MTVLLRASKASKRIAGISIFRDVDLDVRAGTVLAIAGGNGSGKSTLLRVLSGVSLPTHGCVTMKSPERSIVPERFVGPDHMTPLSYLLHLGRIRGNRSADLRPRAQDLLEALGVQAPATVPIHELSKGNAQKVAIAQAFLINVPLTFLDEPNTGLDDTAATVLNDLIRDATRRGGSIVLCEHERSRTVHADVQLELRKGTLTPRKPAPDIARHDRGPRGVVIVLRGSRDAADVGVMAAQATITAQSVNELTLDVEPAAVDRILRTALANGWSVRSVGASPEPDPDPRSERSW